MTKTLGTSTGVSLVETDAGPAYAKLLGNPEGPQALFCEWVGTRAAAWLGLPTFDIAVIDVPESGLVEYTKGARSEAGSAFVARKESGTTWGGSAVDLDSIENPEVMAGLIVLDTWICNCDRFRPEGGQVRRNTRNVFFADGAAKGRFRLVAMDHTHCLTCGRELTKTIKRIDRCRDLRLYGHFPEFRPFVTHGDVRRFARRLDSFGPVDALGVVAGVPAAWCPAPDVVSSVAEFLVQRAAFVGRNVEQMLLNDRYLDPELPLEG